VQEPVLHLSVVSQLVGQEQVPQMQRPLQEEEQSPEEFPATVQTVLPRFF